MSKRLFIISLLIMLWGSSAFSAPLSQPAMGYSTLGYELPAIGSYTLPILGSAANGHVIDSQAKPQQLHQLYQGKYNLLGFIYSNCGDVNGCPLSSYVFYKLKSAMQRDPILASRLRLLSLSFDPKRDSPEVMRLYGKNFDYAGPKGEWHFLTTDSESSLLPLLHEYRQDIQREMSVNGKLGTQISHVLRVFLIDPQQQIRNIYSVEFLHPDIIINDIKTLIQQETSPTHATTPYLATSRPSQSPLMQQAIHQRQGKAADLLALAHSPPLGLPPLPSAVLNTLSPAKIALGRKLFFDRRLSLNSTMSCAMCHVPEQGFTSNEIATAVGFEGRSVRRNTPSVYNVAFANTLFHDAREDSLAQQVWGPFLARNEMANPSIGYVVNKIKGLPDYPPLFKQAFANATISMESIGQALAAYQQTLLSANSPFDRWHYGKQEAAQAGMTPQAQAGFRLFTGKARCHSCHSIGKTSALFTNHALHNTGLGYQRAMGVAPTTQTVTLAPGVVVNVEQSIIDSVSEAPTSDLGYYEVSQNPADRWKYKTPSLRNVALTAPYMHDGSLSQLREVVAFYNQGGIANPNIDPLIHPLNLSDTEIDQIVAFLQSLTGSNVDQLVSDAFAAPIGDTTPVPPIKTRPPPQQPDDIGGDFSLTDHHGKPFQLKQLRGKVVMVFFGYTHCPDVCPTELASLARILKQLTPAEAAQLQGLFISVDPTRDTPEILRDYVPYFHPKLLGLTGSTEELKRVMDAYRVKSTVQKNKRTDKHYFVNHSANLFIIDARGKLAQIVPFGFPEAHILNLVKERIAALSSDN